MMKEKKIDLQKSLKGSTRMISLSRVEESEEDSAHEDTRMANIVFTYEPKFWKAEYIQNSSMASTSFSSDLALRTTQVGLTSCSTAEYLSPFRQHERSFSYLLLTRE